MSLALSLMDRRLGEHCFLPTTDWHSLGSNPGRDVDVSSVVFERKPMKRSMMLLVPLVFGCSMEKWSPEQWNSVSPSITGAVEFATRTAFQNEKVKPHVPEICNAMQGVSDVLSKIDDPNATFDMIREKALQAVKDRIPEGTARDVAILVVSQVLNITFMYVDDKYADLLNQDQSRIMHIISTAVANGINNACSDVSLSSFSFSR